MKKYLSSNDANGFNIISLPDKPAKEDGKFELLLSRQEKVEPGWLEGVIVPLYKKISTYGGIYMGWEGNMP